MSYVVYNKVTWKLFGNKRGAEAEYDTISRARALLTRSINSGKIPDAEKDNYDVIETSEYREHIPMVDVVNILTGTTVQIRACDVGTCCDPSMESYHCM